MIPVSTDYRQQLIKGNRNWVIEIPVFLSGNTGSTPDFTLTNEHIWDNGIVLDEAISSDNSFDVGAAIVGSLKVVIDNIHGNFSQYDFYGAKLTLWLGVEGDEDSGDQRLYRIGFYVVDVPSYNGSLITLNCLDNMTWFDTDFDTSWVNWASSSTTAGSILMTICQHIGVSLANQYFPYYDTILQGLKPEQKLSCREVLQYIAQICCCYCKINTVGQLVLNWYDKNAIIGMIDYDGGTFSTTTTPYSDGDAVDGMLFNPWEQGEMFDGGTFEQLRDRAFISQNYEIEVSTDDIVITGCRVRNNTSKDKGYDVYWADSSVEADHDRYLLVIENNPFITLDTISTSNTKASVIANRVGNILAGLPMRGFSATSLADFSYETGDMATVIDFRGNRYYTWITHFTFTTNNSERFNCGVQSVKQRSEQRFSTLAETIEQARAVVTAYDNAVSELNALGQAAIGYNEYVYGSGGSKIMYRYNGPSFLPSGANPKFPNATVVFKITGDGVFVAQKSLGGIAPDGTCTFTNGYDANSGTAILNLLYVRGLNADWINAGHIDASRITAEKLSAISANMGNVNVGGNGNGNGVLTVKDANGTQKVILNNNGLWATLGTIGGATIGTDRLSYSSSSQFSQSLIGCGIAGTGTIALCGSGPRGGHIQGSIQICNQYDHDHSKIISGLQIDGNGLIIHYDADGDEDWWFNLADGSHGTS